MGEHGRPETVNRFGLVDAEAGAQLGKYNFDTSAKRRIFPTITGSTGIFVTLGQSRIANNSSSPATPYTCTNAAKCINLNPYDGNYYIADDPVLGCTATDGFFRAGWHGRLADKLITAGKYTQVVFIPIAISGSSVLDWISGGVYNGRITVAASWLTSLGLTPTAWLWQQGTTDVINGMAQATYQTNLRSVISFERGLSSRSADKWMVAQDSVKDNTGTTNAAIRAAQAAVGADTGNLLGPDADSLPTTDYDSGPHFNDTGNDAMAGLWSTAIQARL